MILWGMPKQLFSTTSQNINQTFQLRYTMLKISLLVLYKQYFVKSEKKPENPTEIYF